MANVGIGMKGYLGYGVESTYGTPVARTAFLEINSESMQKTIELIEGNSIYRLGMLNSRVVGGAVGVAGDVDFDAQYEGWETIAKHIFGAVSSSNPTGSVYRHNFTIQDVLLTGLTFELFRDSSNFASEANKAFIYAGCKIASARFSASVGEVLKVGLSIIGQNDQRQAKTSESFNGSQLAVYHQGILKWAGGDAEVSQFNLTINNGLDHRPKLGSTLTREPIRGAKMEVTGSFTAEFDSWSKYDDFLNSIDRSLNVHFTGPLIQAGFPYYIDFNINVAKIRGVRVNLAGPGRIMLEIDFKAYRTASINELVMEIQSTTVAP